MARVVGGDQVLTDARFATAASRAAHDAELTSLLVDAFRRRTAVDWFGALDAAGVPCEIASATFARELFDDPEMHRRGWVIANEHEHLERVEQVGMSFSFSATSAMNLAGAPVTGQHSRSILAGLGYSAAEIDDLVAQGVVGDGARAPSAESSLDQVKDPL